MPQLLALASCFLKCFKSLAFHRKNHSELPWDERSLISCIMSQRRRNSQKTTYCPCLMISCHNSYEEEERKILSLLSLLHFVRNAPSVFLHVFLFLCFPLVLLLKQPIAVHDWGHVSFEEQALFFLTTTEQEGCGRCLSCPKQTEPTPTKQQKMLQSNK